MTLPGDFHFSQASLQDYVDCRRRFWLRYIHDVRWPAAETESELENERRVRLGEAFHRLAHQHILGLPTEALARAAAHDADLQRWWEHYLEHGPANLPGVRYPEATFSAPLGGYRLVAQYDLVAVGAGWGVIVDWKTSRRRPRRKWLAGRLQTRVYPYVLARVFAPEQVEMIYWFPDFPDEPERFVYDAAQFRADELYLTTLIAEIAALEEADFDLTERTERCGYCRYRSLCGRSAAAAPLEALENDEPAADLQPALDFDQIAEIEF